LYRPLKKIPLFRKKRLDFLLAMIIADPSVSINMLTREPIRKFIQALNPSYQASIKSK
jgi:hypothetical protein